MSYHARYRGRDLRSRIALEAARLLAEQGASTLQQAKLKAAMRLGAPDARQLPSNQDVELALAEYQQLFYADETAARLRVLRSTAVKALRLLAAFSPRAVGAVVTGIVAESSVVGIHAYTDTPEDIPMCLSEAGIPFDLGERRWRSGRDSAGEPLPMVSFFAGDVPIEVLILPERARRHPPLTGGDGRPVPRIDLSALESLLNSASTAAAPVDADGDDTD